jgi:hypothetical protein
MALNTVFTAFGLTLGQLGDPLSHYFLLGIGGALAVLPRLHGGWQRWREKMVHGDAVTLQQWVKVRWLDTAFG